MALTWKNKATLIKIYNGQKQYLSYMEVYGCAESTARIKSTVLVKSELGLAYIRALEQSGCYDAVCSKISLIEKLLVITEADDASYADKTRAIHQLSKMLGYDAPVAVDVQMLNITVERV